MVSSAAAPLSLPVPGTAAGVVTSVNGGVGNDTVQLRLVVHFRRRKKEGPSVADVCRHAGLPTATPVAQLAEKRAGAAGRETGLAVGVSGHGLLSDRSDLRRDRTMGEWHPRRAHPAHLDANPNGHRKELDHLN